MNTELEDNSDLAMMAGEFDVWKKNSPLLYDLVISHALEWPSLTVQWLPSSSGEQRLLLGTHTSDDEPNALLIADARLTFPPPRNAADDRIPCVEIVERVPHDGEVNRARYMPQRPSIVATKTCREDVLVFDVKERPSEPEVVLKGHSSEGYGLCWSEHREGYLLSGSNDCKICLWDVGAAQGAKSLHAKKVFEAHEAIVEDVVWHPKDENLFGSVGDDHHLMIWDLRSSTSKMPHKSIVAHQDEVNSLSFNPFNEWILVTASTDTTINLFDLRKLTDSLHTFANHMAAVRQVEWSPNYETIFASSADDNRLLVWDLSGIGDEQTPEDAEDGPPELLFVHGGHTAKISEFSWNKDEPWVIASVAEDNILHVWKMASNIYCMDYNTQDDDDNAAINA